MLCRTNACSGTNMLGLKRFSAKAMDASAASASAASKTSTKQSMNLLEWYSSKLDSHPITTKCLTAGVIAGFGDVVCQGIQEQLDENPKEGTFLSRWDVMRTGRFALLGGGLVGPAIHAWYLFLSRAAPGTGMRSVLQRVVMDQFLFTPAFVPIWLASLWTLEGREGWTMADLQSELAVIIPINWCVWFPAGIVNFKFVPVKYQVLFQNVVALFWNAFLSYTQSTPKENLSTPLKDAAQASA